MWSLDWVREVNDLGKETQNYILQTNLLTSRKGQNLLRERSHLFL